MSSSRKLCRKLNILYTLLIALVPLVVVSDQQPLSPSVSSLLPHDEKSFRSTLSLHAIGYPSLAIEDKMIVEESFITAYTESLRPICSFRTLENVNLVHILNENGDIILNDEVNNNSLEDGKKNSFIMHFEIDMKCYDCFEATQLFRGDDDEEKYITSHKEKEGDACFWHNHPIDSDSSLINSAKKNMAPSKKAFIQNFNEAIIARQAVERRLKSKTEEEIENHFFSFRTMLDSNNDDDETTILQRIQDLDCPCPRRSFCSYTNVYTDGYFQISDALFHDCSCRDGYSGPDGWRCQDIDECVESYPCAPQDEGGFCVDTDPDNAEYPKFKCGCKNGYKADPTVPTDKHGIRQCIALNAEESEEESSIKVNIECPQDRSFLPSDLIIDVVGIPEKALAQKEELEEAVTIAYDEAQNSVCGFRSLENVTLVGILKEDGEFIDTVETTDSSRYLQEVIDDDEILTGNVTSLSDIDDDDFGNIALTFNFTLFFSVIMRCFGCPDDALLFDDASRRDLFSLPGRELLDENDTSCICQDANGTTVETVDDAELGVPSKEEFLEEFNQVIVTENVNSIEEAVTVTNALSLISPAPVVIDCGGRCDEVAQDCATDGVCVCKTGFFSPSGRGGRCFDTPECSNGDAQCDRNANCLELTGSYDCECKQGYTGDGFTCSDIDECANGTDDCAAGELCINSNGSFSCVPSIVSPTTSPVPPPPVPVTVVTSAPSHPGGCVPNIPLGIGC